MEEASEIGYLENLKSEMEKNALVAKERTPETLKQNFERSMEAIRANYYTDRVNSRRFGAILFNREKSDRELATKAEKFRTLFEEVVFSEIVHGSSVDLPEDENGEVVLLSADKVAEKEGKVKGETTKHQGKVDAMIGSNDLIFANSSALASRSFGGEFVYQITSKDACIVPLDIADTLPTSPNAERYGDALRVMKYSKNIYSYDDFKDFFATYCASIFDDPKEAIAFFGYEYMLPQMAAVWHSSESARNQVHNPVYAEYAAKIQRYYKDQDIVPPFSPEWQFKGEVKAKKISRADLKWKDAIYLKSDEVAREKAKKN